MTEKNLEEAIEIDAQRFREFYGHFEDGRSATEAGGDRAGAKHLRIEKCLYDKLGQPPSKEYWLGSKSVLEAWKTGGSSPRPRPRKVLQAIYDEWRFDISVNQEFSDRIIVERSVSELLKVDGVALEDTGLGPLILKLKKLELLTKVRPIIDNHGKPLPARARLGFSEVTLAVELRERFDSVKDDANTYKITLSFLRSGQQHQSGHAEGMSVRIDGDRLAWRLFADPMNPMIDGHLMKAQLMDVHDRSIDQILVRVEAAMADFDPVVFLNAPTGDQTRDTADMNKAKRQLQAQILRRRLNKDGERYILASGRVARK
jgi:hypothetical protein